MKSLTGQNIQFLCLKYNKLTLPALLADKNSIKFAKVNPITPGNSWKLNLIEEISLLKKDQLELEFDQEHLDTILDNISLIKSAGRL